MERPLLDPQLLRSFVAIVETGSFTRAAWSSSWAAPCSTDPVARW